MKNIAVIGVGALGRRHLQSLYELKNEYKLCAVEVNETALESLRNEFKDVEFFTSPKELPKEIELAVIATNANVRRMVFEQLVDNVKVRFIIFEKVLFQKIEDFYFVQERIQKLGIKAWVNCGRRAQTAYQLLKKNIKDSREMYIAASGGRWGMGCNTIHILDLIEFLSDDYIENIDISKLKNLITESKRKGFFEFFGTISGSAGKCRHFSITCIDDSNLPFEIDILTDKGRYHIEEMNNVIYVADENSEWSWKKKDFTCFYQSQMTSKVAQSILSDGKCWLVDYDSSMKLHIKFLNVILEFFNKNGMEGDICPIT